jgi:ELWxxDGT repeat protein
MASAVVATALLAAAPSASASGASLVRDINPVGASVPHLLTDVGGTLLFSADDGTHGYELWRSDGTAAGTRLVRDIKPGSSSSLDDSAGRPDFTNVGGTLFFTAKDGSHGDELWRSDGTAAGTRLVRDINPGGDYSFPEALTNLGGTLYFSADDGTHGQELWRSDGTVAGTRLVRDINPGGDYSFPNQFTNVGGTILFSARDDTHGYELWRTDGTAAGTRLVRNIHPDGGDYPDSFPDYLTDFGGTLYFGADDGTHGDELWRSDGTWAGTRLVRNIHPDSSPYPDGYPGDFTNVGGTLLFTAYDGTHGFELWRTDGTAAGTRLVRDINPGGGDFNDSFPVDLTVVGQRLFFSADDGTHGYEELWRSDGTWAGTRLVRDINPGGGGALNTRLPAALTSSLTNVGGTLFFNADDGAHGYELWRSDGTWAGTRLVRDIFPGSSGSIPRALANVGGTLFFNARDGTHGRELWKAVP